jgi:anaerobic selenocysteine-containing dehydrogenase
MTHQRTLTAAHWGVYEVEYDDKGQAAKLHPFSHDPDPSPIGLHMLSDEVTRLRVRRPAFRKSWLEKGPGAATDKRGMEPFVELPWDEALDRVAAELKRVKDALRQQRDLRRLLRLVERRPLPPRPEPGPSLPERDRRLRSPHGFLQPGCRAGADAAHRGRHGRPDVDAHVVGGAG